MSPEEAQEGKSTSRLAATRLQSFPKVSPAGAQDTWTQDAGPRAEEHLEGMVSESPDPCISTTEKSSKFLSLGGLVLFNLE